MIFIENIVFSIQKIGGISVVWDEHIKRLIEDKSFDVHFIEYKGADDNLLRRKLVIPISKIRKRNGGLIKYRRFFNPRIDYSNPFIFHSSDYRVAKNSNAINIVTIHDFIYFRSEPAKYLQRFIKWIHCKQIENALNQADYIICISDNTKKDLLKYISSVEENKITVIHNGVSEDYFPIDEIENLDLPYKPFQYALFVGSRSRYKNFKVVVEAIAETEYSLVIVGQKLTAEETIFIRQYLPETRYVCLSNIMNSELNELYNGAFCLIYPSSYEGFGIPVLEAQKAGCPVIAFNGSSIPEIIGNTQLLIHEPSCNAIISSLNLLHDNELRGEIIQNGLRNSSNFSWDLTYKNVKKVYSAAIEKLGKSDNAN